MKKNKYDLAEDIAWMLYEQENNCTSCFMKKECHKKQEGTELCDNVTELTKAIEKKYLR